MNPDQVGLLIVRVWVEPGSARPARLELRATTDPSAGFTSTYTVTDIGQTITIIWEFLQTVLPGGTSSAPPALGTVANIRPNRGGPSG